MYEAAVFTPPKQLCVACIQITTWLAADLTSTTACLCRSQKHSTEINHGVQAKARTFWWVWCSTAGSCCGSASAAASRPRLRVAAAFLEGALAPASSAFPAGASVSSAAGFLPAALSSAARFRTAVAFFLAGALWAADVFFGVAAFLAAGVFLAGAGFLAEVALAGSTCLPVVVFLAAAALVVPVFCRWAGTHEAFVYT